MTSSLASRLLVEDYTILKKLGEGTFASVFAAIKKGRDEKVAIKQVYVQKVLLDEAMDEVNRLKSL
jgi:serine/threonine protein kinase